MMFDVGQMIIPGLHKLEIFLSWMIYLGTAKYYSEDEPSVVSPTPSFDQTLTQNVEFPSHDIRLRTFVPIFTDITITVLRTVVHPREQHL